MQRTLRPVLAACLLAGSALVACSSLLWAAERKSNYKEASGVVIDAAGAPVAEATVSAPWGGGDPAQAQPVLTDAEGKFSVSIWANSYGVHVLATAGQRMGIARAPGSKKEEPINLRIELHETKAIEVAVQDQEGRAMAGARVNVNFDLPPDLGYVDPAPVETGAEGRVTLRIPVIAKCRGIIASSPDGQMAGIVETGPNDLQATIKLQPLGAIAGQFVDSEGRPLISQRFYYGPLLRDNNETFPWLRCFGGNAVSDEDGNFEIGGLVGGGRYRVMDAQRYETVTVAAVESASTRQLGKLTVRSAASGPSADQQIAQSLLGDPSEKYEKAKQTAAAHRQRVAILLVDPDSAATRKLMDLRTRYKNVRLAMDDFSLVFVDATGKPAKALADSLDVELLAGDRLPQIVVRDAEGIPMAEAEAADISVGGQIDRTRLIDWLRANALQPLDAKKLLDDALADARRTKRRVLVQQTAVWCGPCHLLATYLEAQRAIWEQDYIWIRLDERWAGSKEVVDGIRDPKSGVGIPWLAILDADGKVLNTFTGYPGTPAGADKFLAMLKDNSTRLSDDDLARLRVPLEKK